jgi:hypothetical protein
MAESMKMKKQKFIIPIGAAFLLTASVVFAADEKKMTPIDEKPVNAIRNQVELQAEKDEADQSVHKGSLANPTTGEQINWQVISSGGTAGTSTNFGLNGTAGQTAVGFGSSTNFGLSHGFWQEFGGSSECDCIPGDANGDEQINVGDAVYIIAYVFKGGPPPVPYAICSGDANCDCQCNVGDAVFLIAYVFKGGPAPCSCEEWLTACGPPLRK